MSDQDSNRRAPIIIEHIVRATSVSHIMQHWHVYQYCIHGGAEKDPNGWYDGELCFFDNYIILLASTDMLLVWVYL
jgi:hypothetical protein